MLKVAHFLDEVHKRYSLSEKSDYYNICRKYADKSATIMKWGMFSSYLVIAIYILPTLAIYLWTGEKVPPLRIYAPGMDENTTDGFIILNLFNISILVLTVYVIFPVDLLTINIFTNLSMVSTILIKRLKEFQGSLLRNELTPIDIKRKLLTIIIMYNQYDG